MTQTPMALLPDLLRGDEQEKGEEVNNEEEKGGERKRLETEMARPHTSITCK
jgi:hypothetical protein